MNHLRTAGVNPAITFAISNATILSVAAAAYISSEDSKLSSCERKSFWGRWNNERSLSGRFQAYKCEPSQSMAKGRLADMSCVRGFRVSGGINVGVCIAQNGREYQEDSWLVLSSGKGVADVATKNDMEVFAVFDGHGGDECSKYVTHNFKSTFEKELLRISAKNNDTSTVTALEETLLELDRTFIAYQRKRTGLPLDTVNSLNHGGSTAVVVAVDLVNNRITCSNVGDSRAVLVETIKEQNKDQPPPVALSDDHSPNTRPDEVARILDMGGQIRGGTLAQETMARVSGMNLCPRIYHQNGIGGLNMTRALGDDYLKPLVSPLPETTTRPLQRQEDESCLILASDGVWDVMPNQLVADLVRHVQSSASTMAPAEVAKWTALLIVQEAQRRGSRDNITCMVVKVPTPTLS